MNTKLRECLQKINDEKNKPPIIKRGEEKFNPNYYIHMFNRAEGLCTFLSKQCNLLPDSIGIHSKKIEINYVVFGKKLDFIYNRDHSMSYNNTVYKNDCDFKYNYVKQDIMMIKKDRNFYNLGQKIIIDKQELTIIKAVKKDRVYFFNGSEVYSNYIIVKDIESITKEEIKELVENYEN